MAFEIIKQLARGFFASIGDNELTAVSTMKDPSAFRLAVDADKVERNLGKFGWNTRRANTDPQNPETQDEHAYVQGQLQGEGTIRQRYGAIYGSTRAPGEEASHQRFIVTHEKFQSLVPIYAPNLGNERVTRFYTDGGKFLINWQDDQNTIRAVMYRVFYKPDGSEDHIEFVGEKQFWP